MTVKTVKNPQIERYYFATGGRKTAKAAVKLFMRKGNLLINGKEYAQYFKTLKQQAAVKAALEAVKVLDKSSADIKVFGGGLNAQAEAIRNALAKALVIFNTEFKAVLRREGYMTRDPRMVERKKYGLKKARRAPQWAKR